MAKEVGDMALSRSKQASQANLKAVAASAYALPPIQVLTLEESRTFFDERTRELLGISGDTFIERWHTGRYKDILDDPDHSDIMYLTLLGNIGQNRIGATPPSRARD